MSRSRLPAPDSTGRLFRDYELGDPGDADCRALVVGRLLEEGERDDLRWLATTIGEAEMASWLEHRGARQLSRRSLRFWLLVLAADPPEIDPIREQLWPL